MGCKLCGKPLAYEGAVYCGSGCCARWEGGERPNGFESFAEAIREFASSEDGRQLAAVKQFDGGARMSEDEQRAITIAARDDGEPLTRQIERFTCQKCGKRWLALDVPERLPCTCAPDFVFKYLAALEANGERTEIVYYGPPVDRLQQWPTLIDSEGKLYKVNAQIFASQAVYDKLHAEIATLKAAARDVIAQYDDEATSTTGPGVMKVLKDLVHPPLGAKTPR